MDARAARVLAPLLLLVGCSEGPKPAGVTQAAEPVSALSAFQKMFVPARIWAADAQPLRIAQIDVEEIRAGGGKAGAWEGVFVSQSQGQERRFIFSVIHKPARNLRGGLTSDPPVAWTPGGAAPFLTLAFKKDSTEAYAVAVKQARAYLKKNPRAEPRFLLEKTRRFPNPAWRVYWGHSVSTSDYSVFVDATTGDYLATGR